MTDLEKITNLINYLEQHLKENMNKKKATKKTAKKNVKSYTRIADNLYRTKDGKVRARKMVDGVTYSKNTDTIKEAKAYLKSL